MYLNLWAYQNWGKLSSSLGISPFISVFFLFFFFLFLFFLFFFNSFFQQTDDLSLLKQFPVSTLCLRLFSSTRGHWLVVASGLMARRQAVQLQVACQKHAMDFPNIFRPTLAASPPDLDSFRLLVRFWISWHQVCQVSSLENLVRFSMQSEIYN